MQNFIPMIRFQNLVMTAIAVMLMMPIGFIAYGQIEMNANGKVGIGAFAPSNFYDLKVDEAYINNARINDARIGSPALEVNGQVYSGGSWYPTSVDLRTYIGSNFSVNGMTFTIGALAPDSDKLASLGTSNRSFARIYVEEIISPDMASDIKPKKM